MTENSHNPKFPEGINTSKKNPLTDFLILTLGAAVVVIALVMILSLGLSWVAPYIPFSYERAAGEQVSASLLEESSAMNHKAEEQLQELADALAKAQGLPEEMAITIHYIDDWQVNAMASLGGHIFIYKGLVKKLKSENTLAMVLAHEIAHVKFRHPIVALSQSASVSLIMSLIGSASNGGLAVDVLSQLSMISSMRFSRDQEKSADAQALVALNNHYGHVNGAETLFRVFLDSQSHRSNNKPEFLLTHPLSEKRLVSVKQIALDNEWSLEGPLIPMPQVLK